MAKLACFLALFVVVVVCAEAVRIDTADGSEDRQISHIKRKDPRCKGRTGLFANPKDCHKYIKCVRGDSRDRTCQRDYKFDSRSGCIPPKNKPDCKVATTQEGPTDADVVCPRANGMYPVTSDCQKYMRCKNKVPTVYSCKKGEYYSNVNGACIKIDRCPQQKSEASVCKKANELLVDERNCLNYIKCVNFIPQSRICPPGKAFDPKKKACTKEYFGKCKNNDIRSIVPDDE